MAGDGKTSVAANLAATLVAEDKKVLLIDANFWRPNLHNVFPKNNREKSPAGEENEKVELGLSAFLAGLCGYEIIRPSGVEGLDIIDAGMLPPNPTELLGSDHMKQLLKHQSELHDYVIIDSPPVLVVSDSRILAKLAGNTILVFNAGATRRGVALRAIRELRQVGADISGCALLAAKAMKGGYFREQFKSYQKYQQLQLAHAI
jgi:capsular exopolysaccharide synthesis family protein